MADPLHGHPLDGPVLVIPEAVVVVGEQILAQRRVRELDSEPAAGARGEVAVARGHVAVHEVSAVHGLERGEQLQPDGDGLVGGDWLVAARQPPLHVARLQVLVDHHGRAPVAGCGHQRQHRRVLHRPQQTAVRDELDCLGLAAPHDDGLDHDVPAALAQGEPPLVHAAEGSLQQEVAEGEVQPVHHQLLDGGGAGGGGGAVLARRRGGRS